MQRVTSLSNLWDGQHGPTIIVDSCLDAHENSEETDLYPGSITTSNGAVDKSVKVQYGTITPPNGSTNRRIFSPNHAHNRISAPAQSTIRFQVVIWSVGTIDVRHGRVMIKFRVTLFWNDTDHGGTALNHDEQNGKHRRSSSFTMRGRQTALQEDSDDGSDGNNGKTTVDIPPISILNADSFDTIGRPEVTLLRKDTKLMRWTCLYKASLLQENMKVDKYPHDPHELYIKLGILAHRKDGDRWDRNKWILGLATEEDSKKSTRIPHGLIVDHCLIPEFSYNTAKGLNFKFVPLAHGGGLGKEGSGDKCLMVSLKVHRESGYYDRNIMPLLAMLNVVSISLLSMNATHFFQRALLMLNITFVEVGIRMSLDSKLPSVGYEIKMQSIMNGYFFNVLLLVLESSILYYLIQNMGVSTDVTDVVDRIAAAISFTHGLSLLLWYYQGFTPFRAFLGKE